MSSSPRPLAAIPYRRAALALLALIGLALLLASASSAFTQLEGWPAFAAVLLLAAALLWLAWRAISTEQPPAWLLRLLILAALLRLALGAAWLLALPQWGYDTPVQQAGYVMEDAYKRDTAAWELAQSSAPLLEAFRGVSASDQYGGLLFLSAALYRYLGAATHQPLLVLALAAAVSASAILFTWAFVQRIWGAGAAGLAAWGLALYPEAQLLGSSQMREAFSVALAMAALYALLRFKETHRPAIVATFLLLIALSALLSTPFLFSLLALLLLVWLALDEWRALRRRRVWLALLGLGLAGLAGLLFFIDVPNLWIVQAAEWQSYVSRNASGWVARQFERMPLWGQLPFLIAYGVFRPLLPAAIFADGLPLWRAVAIWRALGWTLLLALLIYASYLALRSKAWRALPGALLLFNWGVVFLASYRGGGDQWDNPRYRSAFAGLQLALAAWAWSQSRQSEDPWLKRAFGAALAMLIWFVPWYMRRYTAFDWPIVELQHVIGLGLASAAIYLIWDWVGP